MNITLLLAFLFVAGMLSSCNGQTLHTRSVRGDSVDTLDNNIMVVYQDRKGSYWFGSWNTGLYNYDGTTLVHFGKHHGLPFDRVDEIKEDRFGNLYFVSLSPRSSVVRFDGYTFQPLLADTSGTWRSDPTDIWFRHSFRNVQKVYRFDGITLFELQLPSPPNLSNPFDIYSIYTDKKGHLWFGTNPVGVCRYDGTSFDWITEEDVTEFRNEGANGVRSITEDVNGDLWFNTEYRYHIPDRAEGERTPWYTRHKSIGGLDGKILSALDEYLSIARDNQDHLWFVTYRDGVWKYDGTSITHYEVKDHSKNITLFSIYKDRRGDLWLGTHENGAYRFNGTSFEKFVP